MIWLRIGAAWLVGLAVSSFVAVTVTRALPLVADICVGVICFFVGGHACEKSREWLAARRSKKMARRGD